MHGKQQNTARSKIYSRTKTDTNYVLGKTMTSTLAKFLEFKANRELAKGRNASTPFRYLDVSPMERRVHQDKVVPNSSMHA